jgi:hypothetical protein
MYLSKSKYTLGLQCEKILWLDKYKKEVKEEINNEAVLDNGTDIGILAQKLFPNYKVVEFNKDLSKMIEDTKNYLKEDNINLCEASFSYNNNFCSVDILKKIGNTYELYEVKSSTHVSDVYLDDVSFQYYVLTNLGLNVIKTYVVTVDSSYVRHGDLELDKLFKFNDITETVIEKQDLVKNTIDKISKYMESDKERDKDLGEYCFSPYPCPYFKYCSRHLPENNIFNIRGMQLTSKIKLYNEGKVSYEDLLDTNINSKYKQQIEFELNDLDPYINKENIKKELDKYYYPIYYLDFESYQVAVPEFDNTNPYMQLPFQYSLHYRMSEEGELLHKEFLGESGKDPRRKLAEQLVSDIPKDSCVLAYNMAFEKMIIKHLASIYPDLKEHLMNIHDHIKDLIVPFKNRDYYCKDMLGSFSIKYVLPALFPNDPSLDYHNLNLVHKGDEASRSFLSLKNLNDEDKKTLREALLRYCELDTYAMVKIHDKLKSIIEK